MPDRIKLEVFVDLDPVPGTFHSAESAQNVVRGILTERIPHYNPMVSSGKSTNHRRLEIGRFIKKLEAKGIEHDEAVDMVREFLRQI